jgi:hypothetical protein
MFYVTSHAVAAAARSGSFDGFEQGRNARLLGEQRQRGLLALLML